MSVVTIIIMDVVINIVLHFTAKRNKGHIYKEKCWSRKLVAVSCGNHRSVKRAIEKTS